MKQLAWIFPVLFLYDNIMGFNGYQFTIFGVGIRILLFVLAMLSLLWLCFVTIREKNISLFRRIDGRVHILDFVRTIDYFVFGFLVINFVWATAMPLVTCGNLAYAIKDFSTLLVLVLYFPCAFLIRTKTLEFRNFLKILYPLLLLLCAWHSIMYIGEMLCPGFYLGYYDFIDVISFGTAVRTDVVIGYGITRIIQVTSIFLIPAIMLTLEKSAGKVKLTTIAALGLSLFSVLITYTKSIWFGVLAGVLVGILGIVIFFRDAAVRRRMFSFAGAFVVLFCVFNYGILNNTIISRTLNTIHSGTVVELDAQIEDLQNQLNDATSNPSDENAPNMGEIEQLLEKLQELRKDAAGTNEANTLRALQTEALIRKWSSSPLFGYGYGAFAEDNIRNNEIPYMYESLLPAMLMKLGVVGLLAWGIFVAALVVFAVKAMWKRPIKFWCWLGTALAYAMAVQTNPFLFTFAGISLMLYLLIFINAAQNEG